MPSPSTDSAAAGCRFQPKNSNFHKHMSPSTAVGESERAKKKTSVHKHAPTAIETGLWTVRTWRLERGRENAGRSRGHDYRRASVGLTGGGIACARPERGASTDETETSVRARRTHTHTRGFRTIFHGEDVSTRFRDTVYAGPAARATGGGPRRLPAIPYHRTGASPEVVSARGPAVTTRISARLPEQRTSVDFDNGRRPVYLRGSGAKGDNRTIGPSIPLYCNDKAILLYHSPLYAARSSGTPNF